MPDQKRSKEETEEYFTQPDDGILFVRHDLTAKEITRAKKRIADGEDADAVAQEIAEDLVLREEEQLQ